jgi:ABC-type uncharacterized transport system ATPase subunit
MNVLYGLHQPDEGEIRLRGEVVQITSPRHAIGLGIGMVHQHFMLIPVMTVAENIVLAAEPRKGALLDRDAARAKVRELSERYGLAVDPDARVEDITVGAQQRVEILRALYRGADVLVLDEPTAGLDPRQVAETRELIAKLGRSRSVLLSSHLLSEVANLCRRVVVLDKGRVLAVSDVTTLTAATGTRLELRVSGDPGRVVGIVTGMDGVDEASVRGDLVVVKGTGAELGQRVAAAVVDAGIGLLEQRVASSGTLEEAYLNLVRE